MKYCHYYPLISLIQMKAALRMQETFSFCFLYFPLSLNQRCVWTLMLLNH